MRQFNPLEKGIKPEVLEDLYNIVLAQKLAMEAKLERIKKEMAIAATKEDLTIDQAKNGLVNLIAYIESKSRPEDELNPDKASLELVHEHLERVKKHLSGHGNGKA